MTTSASPGPNAATPSKSSPLPRASDTALLQQSGEDYFILDALGGDVYEVNATAATVFSLCRDGATYEDAVRVLGRGLEVPGQDEEIHRDVEATVQQFQELGLCEAKS